jgi:hypothetical protein
MSARELTRDLSKALGLPKHTHKAVLTLEAGKAPQLELFMHAVDCGGRLVLEADPGDPVAKRIAQVQFMLRLERFPPLPGGEP